MKPEDIIIGKKYTHSYYMGFVWLGCGKRKMGTTDQYIDKELVLIENPQEPNKIGGIVHQGENSHEGFWDHFRPLGSNDQIFILYKRP